MAALRKWRRVDWVVDAEGKITGRPGARRTAVVAPPISKLHAWMPETRARLSHHNDLAKALDHALERWEAFSGFLNDGRIRWTNNAAECAPRGVALGRQAWPFVGSDRGGERAAVMIPLVTAAKPNDVDSRAWLADALARIAGHPASRQDELLS